MSHDGLTPGQRFDHSIRIRRIWRLAALAAFVVCALWLGAHATVLVVVWLVALAGIVAMALVWSYQELIEPHFRRVRGTKR